MTPGGENVYVGAQQEVLAFRRHPDTGLVELVQVVRDGEQGVARLGAVAAIASSRDGKEYLRRAAADPCSSSSEPPDRERST